MKGLLVSIYRSAGGDCTNGGVSSKADDAVLIKNGVELGPFSAESSPPALYLAKWCDRWIACPENLEVKHPPRPRPGTRDVLRLGDRTIEYLGGWMFGGNFAYTSDSRFSVAVGAYPIPIYDRREF